MSFLAAGMGSAIVVPRCLGWAWSGLSCATVASLATGDFLRPVGMAGGHDGHHGPGGAGRAVQPLHFWLPGMGTAPIGNQGGHGAHWQSKGAFCPLAAGGGKRLFENTFALLVWNTSVYQDTEERKICLKNTYSSVPLRLDTFMDVL